MSRVRLEYAPHPEELSRRISQIDLTNTRRRSGTATGDDGDSANLRYTIQDLLELGPTPKAVTVPPPTPNVLLYTPPNEEAPSGISAPGSPSSDQPTTVQITEAQAAAVESESEDYGLHSPELPMKQKKKKKRSRKGKSNSKKATVTGFEEFYADPPITPAEHNEESELYDIARPLHERVQHAVQRYRQRRNLDSIRANILTKYLILGGIESSNAKQFTGGLDQKTLEEATAEEIAAIRATDHIRVGQRNAKYYDPTEAEHWVVDFQGVVKGFLSHTVPCRFPLDTDAEIDQICRVIKNFLNYLLTHRVAAEYNDDILAARDVCDLAERELSCIAKLRTILPGQFNIAASILHGGQYKDTYFGKQDWEAGCFDEQVTNKSMINAELVFKTGIAFTGTQSLFQQAMHQGAKIINTEKKAYEVFRIERASIGLREQVNTVSSDIRALGVVHLKAWSGPGIEIEDMTDEEDGDSVDESINAKKMTDLVESLGWTVAQARRALIKTGGDVNLAAEWLDDNRDAPDIDANPITKTSGNEATEAFFLEDDILIHFFPGMKIEIVVQELNIGMKFFDSVSGVYCSFHTLLPNENVIEYWKEPVPNTRLPPTEDNPGAEDAAEDADFHKELDSDDKNFVAGKDSEIGTVTVGGQERSDPPAPNPEANEVVKAQNINPDRDANLNENIKPSQ